MDPVSSIPGARVTALQGLTLDAIRALSGPQLTRLAWGLGLAPAATREAEGVLWVHDGPWRCWEPHVHLGQADAVFRQLRARQYRTMNEWYPQAQIGLLNGQHYVNEQAESRDIQVWYGAENDPEALALLRCACLAVASEWEVAP